MSQNSFANHYHESTGLIAIQYDGLSKSKEKINSMIFQKVKNAGIASNIVPKNYKNI